jgi:hypothetical protein
LTGNQPAYKPSTKPWIAEEYRPTIFVFAEKQRSIICSSQIKHCTKESHPFVDCQQNYQKHHCKLTKPKASTKKQTMKKVGISERARKRSLSSKWVEGKKNLNRPNLQTAKRDIFES